MSSVSSSSVSSPNVIIKKKRKQPLTRQEEQLHETAEGVTHENRIIHKKNKSPSSESPVITENKVIKKRPLVLKEHVASGSSSSSSSLLSPPQQPKIKIVKKTILRTDSNIDESNDEVIPIIDGTDMIHEYSSRTSTASTSSATEAELSKDEMIEQIDYQRDILIKNRSKYVESDYLIKLKKIEDLLSNLRRGLVESNLHDMNGQRVIIDKIVLDKKIPEKQFKSQIDLTGEHDDKDPSIGIVINSREYFKQLSYQPVPKKLEALDPKRNKNFGNQPMPPELIKLINF